MEQQAEVACLPRPTGCVHKGLEQTGTDSASCVPSTQESLKSATADKEKAEHVQSKSFSSSKYSPTSADTKAFVKIYTGVNDVCFLRNSP